MTARNNMFVLANGLYVIAGDNLYSATKWKQPRDHNLYFVVDGSQREPMGIRLGEGDIIADPLFFNLPRREVR